MCFGSRLCQFVSCFLGFYFIQSCIVFKLKIFLYVHLLLLYHMYSCTFRIFITILYLYQVPLSIPSLYFTLSISVLRMLIYSFSEDWPRREINPKHSCLDISQRSRLISLFVSSFPCDFNSNHNSLLNHPQKQPQTRGLEIFSPPSSVGAIYISF